MGSKTITNPAAQEKQDKDKLLNLRRDINELKVQVKAMRLRVESLEHKSARAKG
jgi:hypothetical protein